MSTITLPELTARWLQESLGVFTQKTLDHYRALLENHVFPYFGNSVEISQEQVLKFVLEKKTQGLSESTVNTLSLVLRRILEYGASIGECPAPNWDFTLGTAQRKHEAIILSVEEEQRLVKYLTEQPDGKHLGLFLALTLGLSKSEILNLQWKDVSFKLDRIRVISEKGPVLNKRRKKRDIPFGERVKIYLRKMASHPEFYVTSGSGKQSSIEILRSRLVKATGELILPFVVLNDLRRTYAVRSLEGGMTLPELASRLGIANKNSFRREYYGLVSPKTRARLEKETLENRKIRHAPEHLNWPEKDAELTALEAKFAARKAELKEMIEEREKGDRTFFTSDTHFGSVRTLQLSKRPFLDDLEMDWTMIERWNKVVSPSARVIHLGDFGDYEAAKYLNGNITLMYGNYERKDHEGLEKKPIDWLKEHNVKVVDPTVSAMQVKGFEEDPELKLVLGHEPLNVKKFLDTRDADQGSWCLFGHIHARQRVKKFGVDVGVDGNNFTPMSLKDVKFYLEAIDKHYDKEVWS